MGILVPVSPMLSALLIAAGFAAGQEGTRRVDFQREIRTILSERCFACHGPDEGQRKGKLRLDTFEGATAAREDGAAIVPGRPDASALIARVSAADPEEAMPPAKSGKPRLDEAQRELLRRWIGAGARYDTHWAFVPARKAPLPGVRDASWCRDELDRFVLARIEAAGLTPSPEAEPELLLRRVSFDLTGLPPAVGEIDDFLAARAGDGESAYREAVERLLASPHFGEHMAASWLDLARYADTYGYQSDVERRVWPWRDWVIAAFNRNLPYDRFVTEQLAGDLLPDATREQRLATAFNRLHRQTNEGGSVEEEFRVECVADRVNTFATAFLGLTLGCARCHDHKFDPFTTREYYALGAFFDDIDESGLYSHFTDATPTPALALPTEEQQQEIEKARTAVAQLERELDGLGRTRARDFEGWLAGPHEIATPPAVARYPLDEVSDGKLANLVDPEKPGNVYDGPLLVDVQAEGRSGRALRFSGDNGAAFPGVAEFAHWQPFSFALWLRVSESKPRAVVLRRSRAWTDAGSQGYQLLIEEGRLSWSLVHFWPGDAIAVRTREPLPLARWVHVVATYDGSSRAAGLALYVDGERAPPEVVRDHLVKPITGGDPGPLALAERFRDAGLAGGEIDDLSVFERELSALEAARLAGRETRAEPAELLAHYLSSVDAEARALRAKLGAARRVLAEELAAVPEIMVMEDRPEPRPAFVLRRGRYDDPDRSRPVEPGTPAALPPLSGGAHASRLDLARWLTEPAHPLTARVAVNRIWQLLFGRGLVETAEDFGVRGSPPSHPELLDELAVSFVESGWDVKTLVRRIVLSATYRQSSRLGAELSAADPGNLLLARFPTRRLSAEEVRDQALAASGLLVPALGGPSVRPWQPPGLWGFTAAGDYVPDEGDARHRRSLYTFWKRTAPPPNLVLFDAARREVCEARRSYTNTPQQALVLLNDPQFVEAAVALAMRSSLGPPGSGPTSTPERAGLEPGAPGEIERVFRALTGRHPSASELAELSELHRVQRDEFAATPAAADEVLGASGPSLAPELDHGAVAALAVVASTVLSLDASVTLR